MKNLFDQLRDDDVPVMPKALETGLHQRINNLLLAQQVCELVLLAVPFVFFNFLRAAAAAACFSLSGRYPETRIPPTGDDNDAIRPQRD